MYEPQMLYQTGDSVIVLTEDGYTLGTYTGVQRPESESFEIRVKDVYTGELDHIAFYHKEDIYQNNEENAKRLL